MPKFRSIFLIVFCGFIFFSFPAFSVPNPVRIPNVSYSDVNKVIIVKKTSPTFTITLHSNPTTGFMWILRDYDNDLIVPMGRKYFAPRTKLLGAGGYEKWTFGITPKGFAVPLTTSITLIYARSWNLEGAEVARFKVVTANDN